MSAILGSIHSKGLGDPLKDLLRQSAAAAHERGEFRLAELLNQEILSRYPDDREATQALLSLLADEEPPAPRSDDPKTALAVPEQAAQLARAAALHEQGLSTEALAACDAVIEAAPRSADAYILRGTVQRDLGLFEEALESFQTALTQRDDAPAKFALGCLYLLSGDLEQGWPLFDQYHWTENREARRSSRDGLQPDWNGDDEVRGKVLRLIQDQGVEDTLQFARYALLAKSRGATVVLSVQEHLRGLLRSLSPDIEVLGEGEPLEAYDYQCGLSALPGIFNTTMESIPAVTRYLRADPARTDRWRTRLGEDGFKIGVCWQGSASSSGDRRAFPLQLLEPISQLPGVRLISLQQAGDVGPLGGSPPAIMEALGLEFDPGADALLDTAALIECLDLVITCDSPIAHLAGSLGAPTWVALPRVPDWRWLLDRQDSPWYPTLRLFRQQAGQNFGAVMAAIQAELEGLLERRPRPESVHVPETVKVPEATRVLEAKQAPVTNRVPETTQVPETHQLLDSVAPPSSRARRTLRRLRLHRRTPELVSGVMVALMCAEIVNAARTLLPHKNLPPATLGFPSFSAPAKMDVNPIVSAHLFGQAIRTQDPASAPPTAAALKLTGTLATDDPRDGLAIIGEEGKSNVYSVGQAVGGVFLQGIYRDRVVVQRNGQLESLFLPRKSLGPSSKVANAQIAAVANAGPEPDPAPIQNLADSNLETDMSGKLVGIRVVPGKDRVGFAHSGLIGGDIVVAMNGQKIDSESSAEIFKQASTGTAVTVLRRGVLKEITLNFSN